MKWPGECEVCHHPPGSHNMLIHAMRNTAMDNIEVGQLTSVIERIERLEEDKKTVADEIRDVYTEAKSNGYDIKIVRKIVAIRKQDRDKRREEEEILDLYMQALGMQP